MNLEKENIVKFIDAMIAENYSGAHKFLEVVIQENVKAKMKKATKQKLFGGEFPKAKDKKTKNLRSKRNKF